MVSHEEKNNAPKKPLEMVTRRDFLKRIAEFFMAAGLVLSYGSFFSILARYLYPSRGSKKEWLYVSELSGMKIGDSLAYRAPNGEKIAIARRSLKGDASDFVALSSTCPHLGCQVHWEGANNRFFCPCHNGAFDSNGKAIAGPPAEAKQSLSTYPLKVENGVLFIEAPLEKLNRTFHELQYPNLPNPNMKSSSFVRGGR